MNQSELSLLCLLIDAVIDAPERFPRVAAQVLEQPVLSHAFRGAVDVVGATMGKVKGPDKDERRKALLGLAKKLGATDPVVGGAIEWAIANRRTMRPDTRRAAG